MAPSSTSNAGKSLLTQAQEQLALAPPTHKNALIASATANKTGLDLRFATRTKKGWEVGAVAHFTPTLTLKEAEVGVWVMKTWE